jgi:nucleotide-binding universal stress UspA family protein
MIGTKRMLVTTDRSTRSNRVLAHASAFARACQAELAVLQVVNPRTVARRSPDVLQRSLAATKIQLERTLMRAGVEGTALAGTLLAGEDVPAAILRVAQEQGAQLIAMSSRGRGLTSRALFGSVATTVLSRSEMPVLTCGPNIDYPPAGPTYRILFTSDCSPASEQVFARLAPLLESTSVEVSLLYVYMPTLGDRGEQFEVESARNRLQEVARHLPTSTQVSVTVETKSSIGGPAGVILGRAESIGANALALSTHGHSLRRDLLLGSVALEVCRTSPLPVILAGVR